MSKKPNRRCILCSISHTTLAIRYSTQIKFSWCESCFQRLKAAAGRPYSQYIVPIYNLFPFTDLMIPSLDPKFQYLQSVHPKG